MLPLLADHRAISCWLVGSEHAQKLENTVVGRRTGSPLASRRAVAVGVSLAALAVPAAVVAGSSASAADAGGGVLSVVAGTGAYGTPTAGLATRSDLKDPIGVAVDAAGDVYVADTGNNRVEKVTPAGVLTIIAGNGTAGPPTVGYALDSALNHPAGLALDDAGNLYIDDIANNRVEKLTPAGVLSVVAGTGVSGPATPGPATGSELNSPSGVAVASDGTLYIADTSNLQIEKVTPAGVLSVVAGNGTRGPANPGRATSSPLNYPTGVAVDGAGTFYIADQTNSEVEKVTADGQLSLFAGIADMGGPPTPGPATSSNLYNPFGVAVDAAGDVYIGDTANHQVEKVAPAGVLSVIAGTGSVGPPNSGPAVSSRLANPYQVAVDASGAVYIADSFNNRVEKVTAAPSVPAAPAGLSATAGNGSAVLSFAAGGEGGSPVTGYEFTVDAGQHWNTLTTTPGTGTGRSATVIGLSNGTSYTFALRAVNSIGAGPASASSNPVTPLAPTTDPIAVHYAQLGGVRSFLGAVVSSEFAQPGGRAQNYAHGAIYYSPATGASSVHGAILAHYLRLGGPGGLLGYPTTDERATPDRIGRYNHFAGSGGASIYWTPRTGAWSVHGAIRSRWAFLGWERSRLGYPTTDEYATVGGRRSDFTGGSIIFHDITVTYLR